MLSVRVEIVIMCTVVVAVVVIALTSQCINADDSSLGNCSHVECPTWFYPNETTCECQCGSAVGGVVECSDKKRAEGVGILDCYCLTTDDRNWSNVVAGACFFNCERHNDAHDKYSRDKLYHSVPLNLSRLNEEMCKKGLKRAGRLCGGCMEGYQLPAYSYNMKCIRCSASTVSSWITYTSMAFIPLTIFFIVVLVFRVNVTSPKLMSYVLLAQTLATPSSSRIVLTTLENRPQCLLIGKLVLAVYGIWNLDFLRIFSPPICLGLDELQVLALDYAIAAYPLLLVSLAYLLIQMHARGCLLLNILWFPFKRCYNRIQTDSAKNASIIDVFASFLVLAYVKFLCVSFDFLIPTRVYDIHGQEAGTLLYYNANIGYWGSKHLPYGILAVIVTVVFNFFPLILLLLYPLRCFQRVFGNWQRLRIFTDSFQGSYKDGVAEGRYDCRYFAALFFVARILFFITYALTTSGYYYAVALLLQVTLILVLVLVKPYRKALSYCLTLDVVFLSLLALFYASLVSIMLASMKAVTSIQFSLITAVVTGTIPAFYIPALLLKRLWSRRFARRLFCSVPCFGVSNPAELLLDIGDGVREGDGRDGESNPGNYGSVL